MNGGNDNMLGIWCIVIIEKLFSFEDPLKNFGTVKAREIRLDVSYFKQLWGRIVVAGIVAFCKVKVSSRTPILF